MSSVNYLSLAGMVRGLIECDTRDGLVCAECRALDVAADALEDRHWCEEDKTGNGAFVAKVEMWMDSYEDQEEHDRVCHEYMEEMLNFSGGTAVITPRKKHDDD